MVVALPLVSEDKKAHPVVSGCIVLLRLAESSSLFVSNSLFLRLPSNCTFCLPFSSFLVAVDNVLLSEDGRDTFLCDFGLSETLDPNGQSTKAFRRQCICVNTMKNL